MLEGIKKWWKNLDVEPPEREMTPIDWDKITTADKFGIGRSTLLRYVANYKKELNETR